MTIVLNDDYDDDNNLSNKKYFNCKSDDESNRGQSGKKCINYQSCEDRKETLRKGKKIPQINFVMQIVQAV